MQFLCRPLKGALRSLNTFPSRQSSRVDYASIFYAFYASFSTRLVDGCSAKDKLWHRIRILFMQLHYMCAWSVCVSSGDVLPLCFPSAPSQTQSNSVSSSLNNFLCRETKDIYMCVCVRVCKLICPQLEALVKAVLTLIKPLEALTDSEA